MRLFYIIILLCVIPLSGFADNGRITISLNGEWSFDQTEKVQKAKKLEHSQRDLIFEVEV